MLQTKTGTSKNIPLFYRYFCGEPSHSHHTSFTNAIITQPIKSMPSNADTPYPESPRRLKRPPRALRRYRTLCSCLQLTCLQLTTNRLVVIFQHCHLPVLQEITIINMDLLPNPPLHRLQIPKGRQILLSPPHARHFVVPLIVPPPPPQPPQFLLLS